MTKLELIAKMAEQSGLSKTDAGKALNAMTEAMAKAIEDGERVVLDSIGSFRTIKYPESQSRNPKTGEKLMLPERMRVKFKPFKRLKDAVNG